MTSGSVAILIVAGGEARRLPDKMERPIDDVPLLLRVYRNMRESGQTYISGRATFSTKLDSELTCPIIVDRWPGRGPVGGIATVLGTIDAERVFVVAGDAPAVTPAVLDALLSAWQPDDEAVVPEHDGRIEPLAALYDSAALRRETMLALQSSNYAMHAIIERLVTRRVPLSGEYFVNVNTPSDLKRIGADMSKGSA